MYIVSYVNTSGVAVQRTLRTFQDAIRHATDVQIQFRRTGRLDLARSVTIAEVK